MSPSARPAGADALFAGAARRAARRGGRNSCSLADQDPLLYGRKSSSMKARGAAVFAQRAARRSTAITGGGDPIGHVVRRRGGNGHWAAIERLYDGLCAITAAPVAAINRADRGR